MAFPIAAAIAGASALLKAFGGSKQKKAAQKKESDEARLKYESQKKGFAQREKRRIAGTRQLQSAAAARGINMGEIPPEFFQEQEFTGAEPTKETGRSGFGDFLSGAGDIGMAAGDFMAQNEAKKKHKQELDDLMCAINPKLCPNQFVGPPEA